MHRPDSREALVLVRILPPRVENIRTNHRREIVEVHLGARLFVDVREGGDPFKEDKDDFHRVPMTLGHETANEMHNLLALVNVLYACAIVSTS